MIIIIIVTITTILAITITIYYYCHNNNNNNNYYYYYVLLLLLLPLLPLLLLLLLLLLRLLPTMYYFLSCFDRCSFRTILRCNIMFTRVSDDDRDKTLQGKEYFRRYISSTNTKEIQILLVTRLIRTRLYSSRATL